MKLPYAENINFWMTSKSSPDSWIDKARNQIEKLGGHLRMSAYGVAPQYDRSAFIILFEIQDQQFKLVQPILPTKNNNELAARRQAATLIYHEIKSRCLRATITGFQEAFFQYMLLPDGRIPTEMTAQEIMEGMPQLIPERISE